MLRAFAFLSRGAGRGAALLTLLLASAASAFAAGTPVPRESARYGVYMQERRIGAMATRTFDVKYAGRPAVRVDAETKIRLPVLGQEVGQEVVTRYVLDPKGAPLTLSFTAGSDGRTTRVSARFEARRVVCTVQTGAQSSQQVVPIPAGVRLVGDPDVEKGRAAGLKVGRKETMHFFEPLTLTIQRLETEVVKSEVRRVGGKPARLFLVRSRNALTGPSESWVDAAGNLLEDRNLGVDLRIVREDLGADLPKVAYTPPGDFAVATSVVTAVKIPNPRRVRSLRLRVTGVPGEDLVLSDARQRVAERRKEGETWSVTYHVGARDLPETCLPAAGPGAEGPGLGDAPYLNVTDPAIRRQAEALAGEERDRGLIARRIRAWVRGHVTKLTNVGAPRGAAEIMTSRDGVCRDFATLFAAVARAAGVPTRLCSGVLYFREGFFYHAWVECRLTDGEDGWYAFDPTLDDDFVDATHIKFAQGDPAAMFGVVRVVGRIRAEVIEFRE